MNALPEIPTERIAVKLKTAAERMVRKEHPWVFDEGIVKQSKKGNAGDLAIIYDQKKNKLMAMGLYDPYSPIRIKVIHFKTPATIDGNWFQQKVQAAFALRQPLLETDTNSYRLIHGENDGFPGVVADVYAQVLVLKLYSMAWFPYLKELLPALVSCSQVQAVVLRLSRNIQQQSVKQYDLKDGDLLAGTLPHKEVIFKEHGLHFSANVISGHKTGYFLDHRHNRKRVGEIASGKRVLDVFAYAGGFSVHALAGGAKSVVSLDISKQALKMAQKNVALNELDGEHRILAADAFEAMERMIANRTQFDVVVVDPPSFAKSEKEKVGALQAYQRLASLAVPLVARNGVLLLASCSSRVRSEEFFDLILKSLKNSGRNFKELDRTTHDVDHPIGFPEGAYLKCGYFQLF